MTDRTELSIRSGSTGPPSDSMWSGSPFRVEAGVMIGNATESAEHNANLSFFFASLKEGKTIKNQWLNKSKMISKPSGFSPERELGVMLLGRLAGRVREVICGNVLHGVRHPILTTKV